MPIHLMIPMLRALARYLSAALFGASLYAFYLDSTLNSAPAQIQYFWRATIIPMCVLNLISTVGVKSQAADPPKWLTSGPFVLLITASIAAVFLSSESRTVGDLLIPSSILIGGILGALWLWWFERNHSNEIGEARFGPDGKPLGPWQPPPG